MKTAKILLYGILISFLAISCERDFDAPPIPQPTYTGDPANTTIAKIKELYGATTSDAPSLIEPEFIIKVVVTGNDISGNVYKQLYVEDSSGAINIGIDQNSMYTTYRVGQELFIHLKGLSVVNYGGELQIGYGGTNANRISWEVFKAKAFTNDWPNVNNAQPTTIDLNNLTSDMVNKLVRLDNVYFVNGGKAAFTTNKANTSEVLKDGNGKSIDVRTSSYASFAAETLPTGSGTIVGLLGRHNGTWQLVLRSMDDVINFGGELPTPTDPQPTEGVVFYETFGTGTYPSGNRPKIADFTDFDMKAPIAYSDASGAADIRSISGDNGAHVWFPTRDAYLSITGINTSGYSVSDLELSYQVAANLYNEGESTNLNTMTVKCNAIELPVPSIPLSKDSKFYTITIDLKDIPSSDNLTLEFFASGTNNAFGLRLDNIKIATKSSSGEVIITPQP